MAVTKVEPAGESLVSQIFGPADYSDAHEVETTGQTVEGFATSYFLNQPTWLLALSLNTPSRSKVERQIGDGSYPAGSAIGSWKVYERSDSEIVFGDNMGFMEYGFSFRSDPDRPNTIVATTAVKYLWRRTGAFYFSLVKPMHLRFVAMSLKRATKSRSD